MRLLEEFNGFIADKTSVIRTLLAIAKLEAKLAGLSIIPLLLNLMLLSMICLLCGMSIMALLGYGLFLLTHQWLLALSGVLLVNLILLTVLLKYLSYHTKNISFERTRKYLKLVSLERKTVNHELKRTNSSHARRTRKTLTEATNRSQ